MARQLLKHFMASGVLACVGLGALAPAQAAETIWLDSDHTLYSGYYSTGTALTFAGGGVNALASAWSIHGDGKVYQAQLGIWEYGLGVLNGSGDNSHTIDNSGFLDFVALQFDKVVALSDARLWTGWHNMNDTDATIGYSVSGIPYGGDLGLTGLTQAGLPFDLFESGGIGYSGDSYRNINLGGEVGNIWLIGASFNNPEGTRKLDGFKLEKLKFEVIEIPDPQGAVPEPATWAMMLLGFGFIGVGMRRRNNRLTTRLPPQAAPSAG
jgi:hypothetical protein